MTGQIASPNIFSLELVIFIVAVSMVVGTVDLIRQPGWAWRRAGESKIAHLVLVVFLPLVGLGIYLFGARPKVVEVVSAGRAASLPFERFGDSNAETPLDDGRPVGAGALPTFGGPAGRKPESPGTVAATETELPEAVAAMEKVLVGGGAGGGGFFRAGGSATGTDGPQVGVATAYRPTQRTSRPEADSPAPTETVPAGWKADPTGRHLFRYWNGSHWTEDVADPGEQARDPVSS